MMSNSRTSRGTARWVPPGKRARIRYGQPVCDGRARSVKAARSGGSPGPAPGGPATPAILGLYANKTFPDLRGNVRGWAPAAESTTPSVPFTYGKLAQRSRHHGCSPALRAASSGQGGQMSSDKAPKASKTCRASYVVRAGGHHAGAGRWGGRRSPGDHTGSVAGDGPAAEIRGKCYSGAWRLPAGSAPSAGGKR